MHVATSPEVLVLEALVEKVRLEFAPDPRLAVFEVEPRAGDGALTLVGAVSEAAAAEALCGRLTALGRWAEVHDALVRLPVSGVMTAEHAVVSSAVAPVLAAPAIRATQVSQTVLGRRLLVLRRSGRWRQCRLDDGYIGWIHRGYLTSAGTEAGTEEVEGEAGISLGAELLGGAGEIIARLPWGARVTLRADGSVRLPGGQVGRPQGEVVPSAEQRRRFPEEASAVVASSPRWLGVPYLWGGVTQGGVDCSGLVQALYRMHGVRLPRDSDLQARTGEPVDPGPDWQGLIVGDLLFFAEEPGRVSHVALSAGGPAIIHSSLGNGGVARNDLAGTLPLERELCRIFVCARRVIGVRG